jgi:hypothetical protein
MSWDFEMGMMPEAVSPMTTVGRRPTQLLEAAGLIMLPGLQLEH